MPRTEDPMTERHFVGTTAQVVARAIELGQDSLSGHSLTIAKQCVLDWIGVALNANREPLVRMLVEQALDDGPGSEASVLRQAGSFSTRQAALVNGAMGHAIDYDDVHLGAQGHVTAATLPAVLALAEAQGASGLQLLTAFVCGYEVMTMVGIHVGQQHYDHGFHSTGTVGTFGAAGACAVLLNLPAPAFSAALGIAATQAAGLKAQFGTMCKPLHAGKASENGVLAAQLAKRGFSSRPDIIECEQGFGQTMSPSVDHEAALILHGGDPHIRNTLFKFDAACYGTHAAIAAARQLRNQRPLEAGQIRRATVTLEPSLERMCNIPTPKTGLEAKFSVRFNVAMALAGEDTSHPDIYTDAITQRKDLVALTERITVLPSSPGSSRMSSEVVIETADGRHLSASSDTSVPDSDLMRQGEKLLHKFISLATPIVGIDKAREISNAILNLERIENIGEFMALLRQSPEKGAT